MPNSSTTSLNRRLIPLYVAAFFQGFVLWYAIEKLFMRNIGFNDASIGIMVAVYSAVMLLVETPSGILADRWSRKGVLMVGSVLLAISGLICGLSNGVAIYIVGAVFWGLFFAMYSGTYESIVYDTLVEETGDADKFEKYYGRVMMVDSVALVVGALLGGLVAELYNLRGAFYWSVPFALLSILALAKFQEPQLHRKEVAVPLKEQVFDTLRAVLRRGYIVPILGALITIDLLLEMMYEFSQLWLIALAAPVVLYGPAAALLLSTSGLGGLLAGVVNLRKPKYMALMLLLMAGSLAGLIIFRSITAIVTAQVVLAICAMAASVVFTKLLHDSLPSKIRAGSASAVSTLTRIVIIGISLGFGYISYSQSIFAASWILVAILALAIVFVGIIYIRKKELLASKA